MVLIQAVAKTRDTDESPVRLDAREERMRRNLERFIRDSEYSVTEVADLAGIPQANLARWVSGRSSIRSGDLQSLADALGRESVQDFYAENPPAQRTRDELAAAMPMMAKARPGANMTAEDLADYEEFLRRVQGRREKKKPKSSR